MNISQETISDYMYTLYVWQFKAFEIKAPTNKLRRESFYLHLVHENLRRQYESSAFHRQPLAVATLRFVRDVMVLLIENNIEADYFAELLDTLNSSISELENAS